MNKSRKEPPGYWQRRPGYNWLTGYKDGTASQKDSPDLGSQNVTLIVWNGI